MQHKTMSLASPVAVALAETLLWLCSIPSPTGEEKEICDALAKRLDRMPLPLPVRRYGNSLVVPVSRGFGEQRAHVALVGHLDTVRTENGPARIERGRCYGAGAADMKAGLATMIVLAESLGHKVACDLTLVFYAREEGPYLENELGPVLEQDDELRTVHLAVCLEPSDNRLQLGCCGAIHATVSYDGRTAHSARPWEGENAITKAAPLMTRLAALAPIEDVVDGLVYRTVTTVTQARDGGRSRNVVPDVFTLNLNHRFSPTVSVEAAKQSIVDLVAGEGRVEFTDVSPAALPSANHPLVRQLVGYGIPREPKQAWTDVARFASLGIPAVNFGPGENAQAHQKNESTDCGKVFEGYQIFAKWLTEMTWSGS